MLISYYQTAETNDKKNSVSGQKPTVFVARPQHPAVPSIWTSSVALYLRTYVLVVFSSASGLKIRRERALENGMRPIWPVNSVQKVLILCPALAPEFRAE